MAMTDSASFAADIPELLRMVQIVDAAVDPVVRFPQWPFKAPRAFAHIVEFDRVLGGTFGDVLELLAQTYDDRDVTTVVFEPHVSDYRKDYGFLPAFKVEASLLRFEGAKGYWKGLRFEPGGDPTGAIAVSADVIAIAGSSGQWAVWAERDWEIGVLCTPHDSGPWSKTEFPLFGRDIDLADIRGPEGWCTPLSAANLREFWRNVRSRGSG
jgi:hypothetical protein